MNLMNRWSAMRHLIAASIAVLVPTAALAQASIAGVVKDASGSVLPGVTVEAASPALIEKARTVVSDGAGEYKIVDLRPGTYTVTFTLVGFSSVKREGIELTGSFAATVNADMKVGGLTETIVVTGESPIVDVQSAAQERVATKEVLDTIPTGLYAVHDRKSHSRCLRHPRRWWSEQLAAELGVHSRRQHS